MTSSLLWAMAGAFIAIALETVYRQAETFPLWATIPALLLTLCIWQALRAPDGPSYLVTIAGFNLFALGARALSSHFILNEPVVRGNLAAILLLAVAVVVGKVWR